MQFATFILIITIVEIECSVKTQLIQRQLTNTRVVSAETSLTAAVHSASHCAMLCNAVSSCQAFNYQRGSSPNQCEILDTQLNKTDDHQVIYSGVDYDYYEVNFCHGKNPCVNGGTCVKLPEVTSGLTCKCTEQFYGPFCESEVNTPASTSTNDQTIGIISDGNGMGILPLRNVSDLESTTATGETRAPSDVVTEVVTEESTTISEKQSTAPAVASSEVGYETVAEKAAATTLQTLETMEPKIASSTGTTATTVVDVSSCNQTIKYFYDTAAAFTSDKFPSNYLDNINCTYLVSVPGAESISFTINNSSLEHTESCLWDRLSFYEGPFITNQSLFTTCDKSMIDYTFVSSGNVALVHFITDRSITRYGFNVSYVANFPLAAKNIQP